MERNQAFGTFFTYRAGAAYRLKATTLRATLGSAFKEPSFFENYATGYVTGNPALKPERATSWDAGVERELLGGRLVLSATWFAQRFRNLIQFTFAPPSPGSPNYYNVAAANASGLELAARVAAARALSVTAQYTYTRTVAADSGFDVRSLVMLNHLETFRPLPRGNTCCGGRRTRGASQRRRASARGAARVSPRIGWATARTRIFRARHRRG